ncbi:hypothetical protein JOM56_013368 [Amanita muscaria]
MSLPQLPTELLYSIAERIWSSPQLTPSDRICFMLSSKLVSKTWSLIYDDVFSYDIHILSKSFYYHLFNYIALSPSYGSNYLARCKRITFTVCGNSSLSHGDIDDVAQSQNPDQTRPLLEYMSRFDMAKLPSLQGLDIVYYNAGFPDPCAQGFFVSLPEYLPHLSVSYTFSSDISSSTIDNLRKTFTRVLKVRYAQPKVGTLEINGADEYIAAIWESLFPDRKKLIRDSKEEKQKLIPVRTEFDENYAIRFLLVNLFRAQEFRELVKEQQEEEDAAHVEIGTSEDVDEDGPLPPAPDVSRSPTERSVEIVETNVSRRDKRRKGTLFENRDAVRVWENEVQGVKFISSISPDKLTAHPLTFPSCDFLGDVGYVNNAGTFSPLFNALEPYVVQGCMIPSLHGYGQVDVQDSSNDTSDIVHTKDSSKNRVMGAFRKIWKPKTSSARKNNAESKTLDKNVAEMWFKANVDRVVQVYKNESPETTVRRENLVLVVGRISR